MGCQYVRTCSILLDTGIIKVMLSKLGESVAWLLRWYFNRASTSWRRELSKLGRRDNKWVWIGLCILFSLLLFPILTREAFNDSFLLGLSFVWSGFLALSFAYILRNPQVMIIVYVGVIFGREVVNTILGATKDEMTRGNIVGALIVVALGIYLITWANRMKKGDI